MQNKGLVKLFALLFGLVSIYQLSFSYKANQIEENATQFAIEKIADFVHPNYHKEIGFIKDIAAGAPSFAAFTSLIIACFIYIPKITLLF